MQLVTFPFSMLGGTFPVSLHLLKTIRKPSINASPAILKSFGFMSSGPDALLGVIVLS